MDALGADNDNQLWSSTYQKWTDDNGSVLPKFLEFNNGTMTFKGLAKACFPSYLSAPPVPQENSLAAYKDLFFMYCSPNFTVLATILHG